MLSRHYPEGLLSHGLHAKPLGGVGLVSYSYAFRTVDYNHL